jgi:DNA-binding GntR family transcriptional regulator
MAVEPASDWPLSAQLAQHLRVMIRSGQLAAGDRVPSEVDLAREHDVSRDTAQRALTVLAEEGLIVRRRGVGSVVAPTEPVREVRAGPGTQISARLPTPAEREAAQAGRWVPLLAVATPGWPEKLYPADEVIVVVPSAGECPDRRDG